MKTSLLLLLVLWWGGCQPQEEVAPPVTSTTTTAPLSTTTLPEPPPPPGTNARDYIQWTCDKNKPRCRDRFEWSDELGLAYTVWRGHRDLLALLSAPEFLKGGDRALVDLTPGELELVIGKMREVDTRGNRLIDRIVSEQHRDFDPDPLGEWHRSQVRKMVAAAMRDELAGQTAAYAAIAAAFPLVIGCDSIRCRLDRWAGR